jgi:RNA polymerase primary sigma factor
MGCTRSSYPDCGDSLHIYLRDIKHESLLTAADEHALADAIAQGDETARSRMIQANLRLVIKIARDFVGRGMVLDDLVSEGNIGLIRATRDFNPGFGARFSTYASYWIKQSIRQALINNTSLIRLPAHMFQILTKWRRAERAIYQRRGRLPSFDELASYLGLSEAQKALVASAHKANRIKLESSVAEEAGAWCGVTLSDDSQSAAAILETNEDRRILLERLNCLDDRERTVIALRYGLEGGSPLTLKAIGRRIGVTREWVRKIELRALRKMADENADDQSQSAAGYTRARSSRRVRRGARSAGVTTGLSAVHDADKSPRSLRVPSVPYATGTVKPPRVAATVAECCRQRSG